MDVTFVELRCKEVINVVDGRRLGHVSDLVFCCATTKVTGIVVPGERKLFKSKDDLFIPWKNIQKIGDDVILVQVVRVSANCPEKEKPHQRNGFCGDYVIEDE